MERLTKLAATGEYYIDKSMVNNGEEGYYGEAIEKLARFENLYDYLIDKQRTIPVEMEKLRRENKTKTYKFKELMAQKLTNQTLLNLISGHGLE
jgi:hypothetical protein